MSVSWEISDDIAEQGRNLHAEAGAAEARAFVVHSLAKRDSDWAQKLPSYFPDYLLHVAKEAGSAEALISTVQADDPDFPSSDLRMMFAFTRPRRLPEIPTVLSLLLRLGDRLSPVGVAAEDIGGIEVLREMVPFLASSVADAVAGAGQVSAKLFKAPKGEMRRHLSERSVETPRHHQRRPGPRMPWSSMRDDRRSRVETQRASLPVTQQRRTIERSIAENQVTVITAPTGSGKTTQIPQFLLDMNVGRVIVTQPRRIATTSVSRRVAEERNVRLGGEVGYRIRFEARVSEETRAEFVTDGILLRMMLSDTELRGVGAIMIDEAHERTVMTDVVLGLLKRLVESGLRPDLRIIVCSATLDAAKFTHFFSGETAPPALAVEGRSYDVDVVYEEVQGDYTVGAAAAVCRVLQGQVEGAAEGDVLVFLTGQDEIESCCAMIESFVGEKGIGAVVLPLFSALPAEEQQKVFLPAPQGMRKVIISTNIAETSLTIDGVRVVVDCGFVKVKVYDSRAGSDALVVVPVSRAQADQRKGRAGRTASGVCIRLYSEHAFNNELLANPVPELQRANLASTTLSLKALGVNDTATFPFPDPPSKAVLSAAMARLYLLGALDGAGTLTERGRHLVRLPVAPELGTMLISGCQRGVGLEVCLVAGFMSAPNLFLRPPAGVERDRARNAHNEFNTDSGDLMRLIRVGRELLKCGKHVKDFARKHYLSFRGLVRAQSVCAQLVGILKECGIPGATEIAGLNSVSSLLYTQNERLQFRKAVCDGYALNAAVLGGEGRYTTLLDKQEARIHPESAISEARPKNVVYTELFVSSAQFLRGVTVVEPHWLVEAAPRAYKSKE